MEGTKQSVNGLRVINYMVKKAKEGEKLKIILEADVENVSAGSYGLGDVLKALWSHTAAETDVGFSVFMSEK
jgi:hypothetical protein